MTTKIVREPAVLPLSGILLDPMLNVRALSGKGDCKKGSDYLVQVVRYDGKIRLLGNNNWHSMQDFVELLHPTAVNDNGK